MHNQSKREKMIQYTNSLIKQNNDKIKDLKVQIESLVDDNAKKKIADEIEGLEQQNRRLSLRLQEPVQGMILEIYQLRELQKTEQDKNKKIEISNQIHKLQDKILMYEFGRDKNIKRFNTI